MGGEYKSRGAKVRDLIIGFAGWFVINGGIWLFVALDSPIESRLAYAGEGGEILNLCLLPVNALVLILLAFLRRWIALGMLTALALNLIVALVLGFTTHATCGIPFFIGLLPN